MGGSDWVAGEEWNRDDELDRGGIGVVGGAALSWRLDDVLVEGTPRSEEVEAGRGLVVLAVLVQRRDGVGDVKGVVER